MKMFRHMLDKNQQLRDEFERWNLSTEEHGELIEELIMGESGENSPPVSMLSQLCMFPVC